MTLTRTRANTGGFYVTTLKRRTDTEEMMHIQGISSASLGDWVPHLKRTDVNAAIGNPMSVNVLERLIPRITYAIGLRQHKMKDPWESRRFVEGACRFHNDFRKFAQAASAMHMQHFALPANVWAASALSSDDEW